MSTQLNDCMITLSSTAAILSIHLKKKQGPGKPGPERGLRINLQVTVIQQVLDDLLIGAQ